MSPDRNAVYLPLRGLGDFIISASVVTENFTEKVPIILPDYLADLFNATNCGTFFEVVNRADFQDMAAFFEITHVRNFKNFKRLIKDIKTLYSVTNKENIFLLDYKSRRISFLNAELAWPSLNENIYQAKFDLFSKYFPARKSQISQQINRSFSESCKVIIIPGSRFNAKRLNTELVKKIKGAFKQMTINIAEYGSRKFDEPLKEVIYYNSFQELIAIINNYDLIISAESLPYHLAYFLKKAHFVIYNKSRYFIETFMTPFIVENNYYITYDNNNENDVIDRLKEILAIN